MFVQMALETAVETANDKHLAPWMELLREHSIEHTPLSPFIHIELLRQNHLSIGKSTHCTSFGHHRGCTGHGVGLVADGSAIEKTGFRYTYPEVRFDVAAHTSI
jgi:hypothetical protein